MALEVLSQDSERVVYRLDAHVHKKRYTGLDYEYVVGRYINTLNDPCYMRTLDYRPARPVEPPPGESIADDSTSSSRIPTGRPGKARHTRSLTEAAPQLLDYWSAPRLTTEYVPGVTWHHALGQGLQRRHSYDLTLALFEKMTTSPFTHYDLHLNNVILTADFLRRDPPWSPFHPHTPGATNQGWKVIDFGLSAVPATAWDPVVRYAGSNYETLSCGIFPAVRDPSYDRLVLVSALQHQAHHYAHQSLEQYCHAVLREARFDHPVYYGREHLLPYSVIHSFRNLFYDDRMPLLPPSDEIVEFHDFMDRLEGLAATAYDYLTHTFDVSYAEACAMLQDPYQDYLGSWRQRHEDIIYGLLYAYKRARIRDRRVPELARLRSLMERG